MIEPDVGVGSCGEKLSDGCVNMFWKFNIFALRHKTRKCRFVLEYESGKFNWKRMGWHFLTLYPFRIWREAVAYFIPTVFQNRYSKICDDFTLSV